jgi:hypothetical protein
MVGSKISISLVLVLCATVCHNSSGLSIGGPRNIKSCSEGFRSSSSVLMQLPNQRDRRSSTVLFSSNNNGQEASDSIEGNRPSSGTNAQDSSNEILDSVEAANSATTSTRSPLSYFRNLKSFNKQSLSKLGMSALLSYGFVSNVSGVLAVSSAWFIFSKRVSYLYLVCLGCVLTTALTI